MNLEAKVQRVSSWLLRHNRAEAFAQALRGSSHIANPAARWTDVSLEPSSPAALSFRARTLTKARRPPVDDRSDFLVSRCKDMRVLDIGCVAHDVARLSDPDWLHGRISGVASECIGVDIIGDGLQTMRDHGFQVIEHDLSEGVGPLADCGMFDVIVAGELIEHLGSLDMLFRTAAQLLTLDGEMLLTTPNPFAPTRTFAGRRSIVYENVDHVCYLFPSGIAELAERAGLVLAEVRTTRPRRRATSLLRRAKQWAKSSGWVTVGITTEQPLRLVSLDRWRHARIHGDRLSSGETSIYVVRRPATPGVDTQPH